MENTLAKTASGDKAETNLKSCEYVMADRYMVPTKMKKELTVLAKPTA